MIDEIQFPEMAQLQMTPTMGQAIVEALSQEYGQPFHYTKEFSKYQYSDIYYFTTAKSESMVILNPKLRTLYVDNKRKKLVDIAKVKEILLNIIALKPIAKDVVSYSTVEKKLPLPEAVSANIASYLSGESGTMDTQKLKLATKLKKYGLTKKGGRRHRRSRKTRKTRRV